MTDAMMSLRAALEKSPDADLLREMIDLRPEQLRRRIDFRDVACLNHLVAVLFGKALGDRVFQVSRASASASDHRGVRIDPLTRAYPEALGA